jgi:DNA gyrase subunit A
MPLPEDESTWGALFVMFATASGSVRRNDLSDFVNVKANGKLAMRLDAGDRLIGVATCDESQDVLLATRDGKAIRFAVTDVRVFKGRDSDGVRGIRLVADDTVVSMSLLHHADASVEERDAFLRLANQRRRERGEAVEAEEGPEPTLTPEQVAAFEAAEEFVLSVTENGFGKRTSAYEYRITNRGGQGVISIQTSARNGTVVSAFPVAPGDQIMLVTNGGQVIRTPVSGISIVGRAAQGVTIFRVAEGERVVSASRLMEGSENGQDDAAGEAAPDAPAEGTGG